MHVTAIIAAGGRGTRLGADRPKQFLDLAGLPLLARTLDALSASDLIDDFIVALPPERIDAPPSYLLERSKPVRLVPGGRRRQDSVANAVAALGPHTTLVVIHDAARPFVSASLVARTVEAAYRTGAAAAALAASDTVKEASNAAGSCLVERTLPRERIYLAQTPQAFQRDLLERALAGANEQEDATDEAMLAERAGFQVQLVAGDPANVKLTTAADFESARIRLAGAAVAPFRIGTGYDLHRLAAGRRLMLAGVHVPFALGLHGHSDADIVCHAVTDAVLGATGEGDIGRLFPDTDPQWAGADSLALLAAAAGRVRKAGWRVGNVDVTVIAQQPKLLPHLDAMRANLARALDCDIASVSIKGKTNEGVDSMGRGESMACHAVALVVRRQAAPE